MTNREFENYLALVSRLLRLKRGQCEQIAVELRDHLELRVAELVQSGTDPEEATRRALEEFGDAASLAGQFQFITESYQKRWMMRFATFSVAGLFLAAVFAMAMWPTQARFGAPDSLIAGDNTPISTVSDEEIAMSDNTRRNIEIRKILMSETDFNFDETEFAEVMDSLMKEYQFNVILDASASDDLLPQDEPIKFKVNGIPINKALKLMLREHNATYLVSDGVVRIISLDAANDPDYLSRQIFDVSKLLEKISKLERHRIGKVKHISNTTRTPGGGGGGIFAVLCQAPDQPQKATTQADAKANQAPDLAADKAEVSDGPQDSGGGRLGGGGGHGGGGGGFGGGLGVEVWTAENMLTDLVRRTIAPDLWSQTNGDGTLEILGGLMIVNQTEAINEQIAELLQDLDYRFSVRLKNPTWK